MPSIDYHVWHCTNTTPRRFTCLIRHHDYQPESRGICWSLLIATIWSNYAILDGVSRADEMRRDAVDPLPRLTLYTTTSPGHLPPLTTATEDNCPPDNCPPGQLPSRENAYPDNCPPSTQSRRLFCHLYTPKPYVRHKHATVSTRQINKK